MSLTVDGVWKAGAWAPTVWADGVWREGTPSSSLTVDGVWKAGVWAPTVWVSGVWYEGAGETVPPEVPAVPAGPTYLHYDVFVMAKQPQAKRKPLIRNLLLLG